MAIIGIDLGTTNSLAAVWQDGKSVLIPNSLGEFLTPSVVSIDDGSIVAGEVARQRLISHPDKTASLFKQWMGTPKTFSLDGRKFLPEDLSSFILRSLKRDAEEFLNEEIAEAIISVPAYFSDQQRAATKLAGQLAGFKVDRIINEPSAAALAYRQHNLFDGTNLVIDFGGGTLDVSVLDSFGNIVDILAVSGDNHLGGSDIDKAMANAFLKEHPDLDWLLKSTELSSRQYGVLLKTAENCKIALTENSFAYMTFNHDGKDYAMSIDNKKLTEICSPILVKFDTAIKRALLNAEKGLPLIDNVILVGGSCRMPLVGDYIKFITRKPVLFGVDPDLAVAVGLGVVAGIKERNEDVRDMVLMDICPFSLGVESRIGGLDDRFASIIPRNSALPVSRVKTFATVNSYQEKIHFKIYQGEYLEASKNLLLGECSIDVPPLLAGEASVDARFTYDINGILDIELKSNDTGAVVDKLIVSNNQMTEEKLKSRLEELNKLKMDPRGDEENKMVLARGQRLYEEYAGHIQEEIEQHLVMFEHALKKGRYVQIMKAREKAIKFFDYLDFRIDNLLYGNEDYDNYEEDYEDEDYSDEE